MTPTADRFRALARSSPWRWTSLHLTRHGDPEGRTVEAWIDRASGSTRVREPGGRVRRITEDRESSSIVVSVSTTGTTAPAPEVRHVAPRDLSPRLDADGLVAERPEWFTGGDDDRVVTFVDYGDPLYGNYQWVAMLDPVELSANVVLTDVVAGERRGRSTWTATAVPVEGYDPTCSCCPLLASDVADRLELGDTSPADRRRRGLPAHPTTHRVSLDVETGIVVVLAPHGGDSTPDDGWSVEIHEVDGPAPKGWSRTPGWSELS